MMIGGIPLESGIGLIATERKRQISEEGYRPEHDVGRAQDLMAAAECYLQIGRYGIDAWHLPDGTPTPPGGWPWSADYYRPSEDRTRNLEKAGALIAAAIDALKAEDKL
jgi:hypothetical protein